MAFANATMPWELVEDLRAYLAVADYPLAVRSSSLLEDSHYQPFAGIFETHFLPNNHVLLQTRVERLIAAIKLVYASVYCRNSRHYIEATGNRSEEEKMALVLQKIVGKERDGYFYPMISGTARSYNFYSVGRINPEEGIAYTALGLGKTIMEGENCLFFSPANPQVLPTRHPPLPIIFGNPLVECPDSHHRPVQIYLFLFCKCHTSLLSSIVFCLNIKNWKAF